MMMKRFKMLPAMFIIYIFSSTHMFCFAINVSAYESKMETYIVQIKKPAAEKLGESEDLEALYGSFVPRHRIVHSYRHVMIGFAARLTATEAKEMEKKKGLVSIRPQRILSLQTTYTPTFLGLRDREGLQPQLWEKTYFGKRVIIGVLDTGITPNHPSFSGEKIGSPPKKWKGECNFEPTVCNNKLIGARNMVDKKTPPIDEMGHGTHTASIAAGNFVEGASFSGLASGIVAGMAPHAHLAIYKVCSSLMSCEESVVIDGFEAAIEDGVDVISLSISGSTALPFDEDAISKAAFAAVKKGILVTCAAGNSGPTRGRITNVSPWMLTVGASTIDRSFPGIISLFNDEKIVGESLVQPTSFDQSRYMSLVFSGKDGYHGDEDSEYCRKGSLTHFNVGGKIVLCETGGELTGRVAKGEEVKRLDGKAMILINSDRYEKKRPDGLIVYDRHVIPTLHVSYEEGHHLKVYVENTEKPRAKISFMGTTFGSSSAPMVAEFSSRGPNPFSHEVIKPDIIGPGVQILGAWLNTENNDIEKNPTFAMLSGTSMATAHVSGIVLLLKSSHPDWTPHVIMSAIITTAYTKNRRKKPITNDRSNDEYIKSSIFDMGAGHVNPSKANDPGLVYAMDFGEDFDRKPVLSELNYPSFSIALRRGISKTVYRIVTNVGPREAIYTAQLVLPKGVDITLDMNELEFHEGIEKVSYSVTFTAQDVVVSDKVVQGYLSWVFDEYEVRSPIVITFV